MDLLFGCAEIVEGFDLRGPHGSDSVCILQLCTAGLEYRFGGTKFFDEQAGLYRPDLGNGGECNTVYEFFRQGLAFTPPNYWKA